MGLPNMFAEGVFAAFIFGLGTEGMAEVVGWRVVVGDVKFPVNTGAEVGWPLVSRLVR